VKLMIVCRLYELAHLNCAMCGSVN